MFLVYGAYDAGLTSFLCFAFCFALMLMLSCEPGLKRSEDKAGLRHYIIYSLHLPLYSLCFAPIYIYRNSTF